MLLGQQVNYQVFLILYLLQKTSLSSVSVSASQATNPLLNLMMLDIAEAVPENSLIDLSDIEIETELE